MRTNRTATAPAVCERCGDSFLPKRQTKGRFCSAECYRAWWRENGQREYARRGLDRLEELRAVGKDPRATEQAALKRKMAFRNTALQLSDTGRADDDAWAQRASYWHDLAEPRHPEVFFRKPPIRRPLVLAGHGVRIRIDKGTLLVTDGLTHHPQTRRERRYFPGDPRLPSRIVVIDSPNGSLTLDAIAWLSRQSVPLVMIDWRGQVVSVTGLQARSPDTALRDRQIDAQLSGHGFALAIWLIREKLRSSIEALREVPPSRRIEDAVRRIHDLEGSLRTSPPKDVGELLIIEARGASTYFGSWQELPIRWKGTGRRPIPPEWRRMPIRQSLLGGSNRNAGHPVASALNYGYAVVESQIREAIALEGLDSDVSYLHASRPGRAALVFDLMEPLRPLADRVVLHLVQGRTFEPGDVYVSERGVCRLNPELARLVASSVSLESVALGLAEHARGLIEGSSRI